MKKGLLIFFASILLHIQLYSQTSIYVDSLLGSDSNTGLSWGTSVQSLAKALKMAHEDPAIEKVFVAKGTYYPAYKPFEMGSNQIGTEISTLGPMARTFHIRTGLEVYGGYPNGGGVQNIISNPTILEGALNAVDSVYHVVLMDSSSNWNVINDSSVLEGFLIQHATTGNSIDTVNSNVVNQVGEVIVVAGKNRLSSNFITNPSSYGAFVKRGDNIIQNCVLTHNLIAIFLEGGQCLMLNNTICYNKCTSLQGAGVYCTGGKLSLFNNLFYGNYSVLNNSSNIDLYLLTNSVQTNATLNHNLFQGSYYFGAASMVGNIFNRVPFFKGGNLADSLAILSCSVGIDDGYPGVATIPVYDLAGNPRTHDVVYINNTSSSQTDIGAFENQDASVLSPVNNSITTTMVAPLFRQGGGAFTNSVVGATATANWYDAAVGGNLVQYNKSQWTTFIPILATTSYFAVAAYGVCESGNRIKVVDSVVACSPFNVIYVDSSKATSGNGSSWSQAYNSLGEALDHVHSCGVDTIKIAKGTYFPTTKPFTYNFDTLGNPFTVGAEIITTLNEDKTFQFRSDLVAYGGYPSGGGVRNSQLNPTILSGILANGDTAFHTVISGLDSFTDTCVLDGLIIENGRAKAAVTIEYPFLNYYRNKGGGILNLSNLKLNNTTLRHNRAFEGGGYCGMNAAQVYIYNTTVENNYAEANGGGLRVYSNIEVQSSTFYQNSASFGAAIFTNYNEFTLKSNLFANNTASAGCLYALNLTSGSINNNTFYNNSADSSAAAILFVNSSNFIYLRNNLFFRNKIGTSTLVQGVDFAFQNVSNNQSTMISNSFQLPETSYFNTLNYNYSLGSNFNNKFLVQPQFEDSTSIKGPDHIHRTNDDGLRLQPISVLIDSGVNSSALNSVDILGHQRIQNGYADIGAYEFGTCPPSTNIYTPVYDTVCYNQNVINIGGYILFPPGAWNLNLMNAQGCDSLIFYNVYKRPISLQHDTLVACDSFYWSVNNQTYYTNTFQSATGVNSVGCPHTYNLHLTVKHSTVNPVQTVSAYASYTWPVNNQTYTTSGIYTHSGTNSQGCSDLYTLNLTILDSTVGIYQIPWEQDDIILFPNPTQQQLHLNIEHAQQGEYTILFFDISGRKVKQIQLKNSESKLLTSLSVGDLANGVYKVSILEKDQLRAIRKIEIVR